MAWNITCYINIVQSMLRHQKLHRASGEPPTIALSHHVELEIIINAKSNFLPLAGTKLSYGCTP